MDLDIIQSTKEGEITQFLCDVRDYFKAALATSEYENTSNMFYLTASESTEQLLNRCECLLNRLKIKSAKTPTTLSITDGNKFSPVKSTHMKSGANNSNGLDQNHQEFDHEDVSYLDMSAPRTNSDRLQIAVEESDKAFRCSTLVVKQNKSFLHRLQDTLITSRTTDDEAATKEEKSGNRKDAIKRIEEEVQIYDICQVTSQASDAEEDFAGLEETQKAIAQEPNFLSTNIDCPYADLPAGHLPIKKAIKYGQLLKIEKRLFFDQSKKCYCGILNDWLLCYADGPTSNRPTISLYLKMPNIEIEHFGEGKRREICFQITTYDPNKRFVFQAVNEIDAKEWIHAVETAIRNDVNDVEGRNSSMRKLPTPPVIKKITFLNSFARGSEMLPRTTSYDEIYEEPSPINQIVIKPCMERPPTLPQKQNNLLEFAAQFEYDTPKCPPQPIIDNAKSDMVLKNPYENSPPNMCEKTRTLTFSNSLSLGSSPPSVEKCNLKMEENLDFQAKVKDVHNKLTSQLSSGPKTKRTLTKSLSATSQSSTETSSQPSWSSPLPGQIESRNQMKASPSSNNAQKVSSEKSSSAKNWFLNRLNKTTSSTRSNSSSPLNSPFKCKQSEKENLLTSCDNYEGQQTQKSPVSKFSPSGGTSKVNMIINQLEASGHLTSMFNVDAVASFSSFCENDFSNYEPIMPVSTSSTSLIKKV